MHHTMEYMKVDGYRITAVVGEGRYSTVHKAEKADGGKVVAIKCASKSENLFSKSYIENEKRIVGMLRPHRNVVMHETHFEDDKYVWFVMEYLNGFSLRREITESFFYPDSFEIPFQLKKLYLLQIVAGLKHLHSLNIYHCDLKPENIVVVGETIKIVDFGCSVHSLENLVCFKKKCINSTPGYGAPETIAFDSPGAQILLEGVDVWALGCVIYFMFSGITPFVEATPYETLQNVQHLRIRLNILPDDVQSICKGVFVGDIFARLRLCEVEELINTLVE